MIEQLQANWIAVAVAVIAVLLVARWLLSRGSKAPARSYKPDVLDEGVGPAQRNQALIDSAPAAQVVAPPAAELFGGIGEVIAAAVHEEVIEAQPAAPEPAPAPEPAAAEPAQVDDLSRIKGLGPKLKGILAGLGVTSFAQIAAWSDEDIARIDAQLGTFAGRPARDNWVEQAKLLASGDTGAYESKFGKL